LQAFQALETDLSAILANVELKHYDYVSRTIRWDLAGNKYYVTAEINELMYIELPQIFYILLRVPSL